MIIEKGKKFYFARQLKTYDESEVIEIKIRSEFPDYYVGVKEGQAFIVNKERADLVLFMTRKEAIERLKEIFGKRWWYFKYYSFINFNV